MRKKQLALQNAALFAEIERKTGEIETLHIKLEELKNTLAAQQEENRLLTEKLIHAEQQWADALAAIPLAAGNQEEACEKQESPIETQEQSKEFAVPAHQDHNSDTGALETNQIIETTAAPRDTENLSKPKETETTEKISTEKTIHEAQNTESSPLAFFGESRSVAKVPTPLTTVEADHLRAYAAELIGRLTRQTARLLNDLENNPTDGTEAIKTQILGKNEGFKLTLLTLLKKGGDPAEIKAEMDCLANETETYILNALSLSL